MNEKGISPPPRVSLGASELSRFTHFMRYLIDLDKWFQRLQAALGKTNTYSVTFDPGSVAANTTSEQTVTVKGLNTQDIVMVNKPTHTAGLGIVGARVSATNTLAITFMNTSGSAIDPGSEKYTVFSVRL
ncbi:MAG: hypothetical protein ACE5GZ_14020 [Gammaproteobacteria bacterium]